MADTTRGADLHAVVLQVESRGPAWPAAIGFGHRLRSWVLDVLGGRDDPLATRAHSDGLLTPSPLLNAADLRPAPTILPGVHYLARVAFLDRELHARWCARMPAPGPCPDGGLPLAIVERQGSGPAVRARGGPVVRPFRLVAWSDDPAAHVLADQARLDDLGRRPNVALGGAITVQFLSPTLLRAGLRQAADPALGLPAVDVDLDVPLPVPDQIVRGLAGRWNRHVPPDRQLAPGLIELLARCTAIEALRIATPNLPGAPAPRAANHGFVGAVTFRCMVADPGVQRTFAALWDFASFSGVGAKTAYGYGFARVGRESTASLP